MFLVLGRMILARVLADDNVKKLVIAELREAAKKSETKFDDSAVDALDSMWGVIANVVK